MRSAVVLFFFFNDTATTEIYPLSLHDALPIYGGPALESGQRYYWQARVWDDAGRSSPWSAPAFWEMGLLRDRKSTRLNSSHSQISYAVFCLKKKNNKHVAHVTILDDSALARST